MKIHRIITGLDLGKALYDAGIIPQNCGDLIIEVPVGGPVIIHMLAFADERLLNVIGASVSGAKIQVQEVPDATNERTAPRHNLSAGEIQTTLDCIGISPGSLGKASKPRAG